MTKQKGQASTGLWWIVGLFFLMVHMIIIAKDVQSVVEDPNVENKPGEILKLAVDLSRYAGK